VVPGGPHRCLLRVHHHLPVVLLDGAADDEVLPGEFPRIITATEGRLRLCLHL
jgi:hypothetical protein